MKNTKRNVIIICSLITIFGAFATFYSESYNSSIWLKNFLYNFFPDMLVALAVYLLLEDGVEYLTKFTKVGSRKTSDLINSTKETKREIIIFDTFISNLLFKEGTQETNSAFLDVLGEALKREVKVKILLLHPMSDAAKQRNRDLADKKMKVIEEMEKGLVCLFDFVMKLSREAQNNLQIKLYNATPIFSLFLWDSQAYLTFFDSQNSSEKQDNLIINIETGFGMFVRKQFDKIWDLKENRAIEDYLCLSINLAGLDGNKKMYFLNNFLQDNTPRYIVYEYNGGLEKYLNKNIKKEINILFNRDEIEINILRIIEHDVTEDDNSEYSYIIGQINQKYDWTTDRSKQILGPSPKIFEVIAKKDTNTFRIKSSVPPVYELLKNNKYYFLNAENIKINSQSIQYWKELLGQWENLSPDTELIKTGEYIQKEYNFRYRKFISFEYDCDLDNPIFDENNKSFKQYVKYVAEDNPKGTYVNKREFELIDPKILKNPVFLDLIKFNISNVYSIEQRKGVFLQCYAHFFRISAPGKPSPEGIHSDGHDVLAIHLMDRVNVEGGITEIYKNKEKNEDDDKMLDDFILLKPMDTVYLLDKKVRHFVTDITPDNPNTPSYRDVLIFDFEIKK